MPTPITVPRLGWSMDEGTFVGWLKKDGQFVKAGEPLFTLEGDKAAQEVEATDSGILRIPPDAPNFDTAMAHLYRGEMHRMATWRQRLDITTNWAMVMALGMTT